MPASLRIVIPLVVALAVFFGYRAYDVSRGTGWVVSPDQIAAARAAGRPGLETSPGTMTVLPIRSETADLLPLRWITAGFAAGAVVSLALRKSA